MIQVGLTGGIGCGKTYVANLFLKRGIPVYFSDTRAKQLMNSDPKIRCLIMEKFGKSAYNRDELNRILIAQRVFNNPEELEWLNQIVHPAVEQDFKQWAVTQIAVPYVIKEAAILIESGVSQSVDFIIVVSAPLEVRIKRVMIRDNVTKDQVLERIQNQMPESEKINQADFVLVNDGIQLVEPQIKLIHNHLITVQK